MNAKITIYGRPATKKNSSRIVRCGNYPKLLPSKIYEEYEKASLWRLKGYQGPPFKGAVALRARYWMPDRRSWPDLAGLIQATQDILQKAGIISDDKQVVSLDGCRIAGIDRENSRVEIEIEEVAG